MQITRSLSAVSCCLLLIACGCEPYLDDVGGLTADDFEKVSLNGFEAEDNAVDKNDYAWCMEYFKPDGADEGYVYVGTGNDMIGIVWQAIPLFIGGGEAEDIQFRPPEIRRYRGEVFPNAWERVFDYREVETDPDFETLGFRYMTTYRAASDGVLYLYASTMGMNAAIWRTASGDPGTWEPVYSFGEPGSVRWMTEHNGILYLAWSNEILPIGEAIAQIWATDGESVWPVVEDGFGNPDNRGVVCLASCYGWLYAGTGNAEDGYEIWKLVGPEGEAGPKTRVVEHGGPSRRNESAHTPCVFQGQLYFGSASTPASNLLRGFKAADIIRVHEDDTWEVIVGEDSLSGYGSGFGHWPNAYIWWIAVHDDWMYAATYDQISGFFNTLENLDKLFASLIEGLLGQKREANIIEALFNAGADLYKTPDGVNWYPVLIDGFGDVGNYGFRVMKSVDDYLYVGTTNPFDGLEIWRGRSPEE